MDNSELIISLLSFLTICSLGSLFGFVILAFKVKAINKGMTDFTKLYLQFYQLYQTLRKDTDLLIQVEDLNNKDNEKFRKDIELFKKSVGDAFGALSDYMTATNSSDSPFSSKIKKTDKGKPN